MLQIRSPNVNILLHFGATSRTLQEFAAAQQTNRTGNSAHRRSGASHGFVAGIDRTPLDRRRCVQFAASLSLSPILAAARGENLGIREVFR